MWLVLAIGYGVVLFIYGMISSFAKSDGDEWAKRYSEAELAVMVIFWPVTLLMALQLVPGILDKMRDEDEADE